MKPQIAVVVPNWNGQEYLGNSLRSLQKQSVACKIVVVDNGSTDDSVTHVQKNFPEAEVLEQSTNLGFAGGVNKGIEWATKQGFEYIALFNNDAVADKDWLKHLHQAMLDNKDAGIVTGKLLKDDRKHLDSTGEFLRKNGMPFPRGRGQVDKGQFDAAEYVFGATGGASLYRSKLFKKIGLFDEDFFLYFEDVDISFRAQLSGFKVWYEPRAEAYHHIGQTSSRISGLTRYHSVKNYPMLFCKNMPGLLFWKYKPAFFTQLLRMKLGSLRDHQFGIYMRAFCWALLRAPKTLFKRWRIQKNRAVDPTYIQTWLNTGQAEWKKR